MSNQFIQVSSIVDFKRQMENLWRNTQYDFLYVSIGSKLNEYTYDISGINGKRLIKKSNAMNQMIPAFVMSLAEDEESTKNVLCISLDRFEDAKIKKTNQELVLKYGLGIDFIQYDDIGSLQVISEFIYFLIEMLDNTMFDSSQFMIANYIRFLHTPNHIENLTETSVPDNIHNILSKTRFSTCFYQWYGYQNNLYNLIYNYKKFHIQMSVGITNIIGILQLVLKDERFSKYDIDRIEEKYTAMDYKYKIFHEFLKNSIDITQCEATLL